MARVRFLGPEPVIVPELGSWAINPDQIVEIPDDRFDGYACQPNTWQTVEEPAQWRGEHGPETVDLGAVAQTVPTAAVAKKTAPKSATKEG